MQYFLKYRLHCILLLLVLPLSSCDNTVQPFTESDANFGLFGFLDTAADTQFVRVEPRRETQFLEEDLPRPSLISTSSATGLQQIWQDSVVTTNSGNKALLYWTNFRPEKGVRYDFTASGLSLTDTEASTIVPEDPSLSTIPEHETNLGTWEQGINISRIDAVVDRVTVVYTTAFSNGVLFEKEFDYFNRFLSNLEAGWRVIVRLERDFDDIRTQAGYVDDAIPFREIKLVVRYRSADWVSSSRLQSNVSSGLGFVGSVMTYEQSWTVDTTVLSDINVRDEQNEGNVRREDQ